MENFNAGCAIDAMRSGDKPHAREEKGRAGIFLGFQHPYRTVQNFSLGWVDFYRVCSKLGIVALGQATKTGSDCPFTKPTHEIFP